MKKLSLKNLKEQEMDQSEMMKITGGYYCGDYYCTYVNPQANCC
ncbi:MAG: TIGR04149 family rSAM-modified RiPP [Saonia sp.]